MDHYIRLRQAGVEAPERETFRGALKSGRMALENLGLGAYEARERADLFRRFNAGMVEEMAAMAGSTATERAAVFKRTSAMLTEIINEDRNHLSLIQRHGWQGTEEGKHTGDPADEPESKPSECEVALPAILKNFCIFTLPPVDERLSFPYSGGSFLHPGNFQ